ncbi:MAG: rhodanese-like domain-containing protein [Verrucomicrobiaceae bacterium]|nr:rhodanese-like domain-containing protein [Verrucomicrobiaceae bacterium]
MFLLLLILVAVGLLCGVWFVCEYRWDLRLFGPSRDSGFVTNVRAGEAAHLLLEGNLLPLDVRPSSRYRAEHLPGAIHAPFSGAAFDAPVLECMDRDQPVLVYCDGGYRSRQSLPALREAGFTSIYHLHRGLMSWKLAKEPTESDPAASSRD